MAGFKTGGGDVFIAFTAVTIVSIYIATKFATVSKGLRERCDGTEARWIGDGWFSTES